MRFLLPPPSDHDLSADHWSQLDDYFESLTWKSWAIKIECDLGQFLISDLKLIDVILKTWSSVSVKEAKEEDKLQRWSNLFFFE